MVHGLSIVGFIGYSIMEYKKGKDSKEENSYLEVLFKLMKGNK